LKVTTSHLSALTEKGCGRQHPINLGAKKEENRRKRKLLKIRGGREKKKEVF